MRAAWERTRVVGLCALLVTIAVVLYAFVIREIFVYLLALQWAVLFDAKVCVERCVITRGTACAGLGGGRGL